MGTIVDCMLESGEVRGRGKESFQYSIVWKLLKQLFCSVADYAVDFSTLATDSAWNPEVLFDMFLHGMSEEVKDELAAQELLTDLDSLMPFDHSD